MRTKEFQCGGDESSLLDCRSSGSDRNTCSPVGLTCSDPENIRLVGEASRCAGTLEVKSQGDWRPVDDWDSEWDMTSAAAVCTQLHCGSAVSTEINRDFPDRLVWWITASCVQSAAALSECVMMTDYDESYVGLDLICSDLLTRPNISLSSADGEQLELQVLTGSDFNISCSTEPQYPGGSFQLIFTSTNRAKNHTLPAVNHSAHFPFFSAGRTHRGEYRCVYHVYVFSQNFSSESRTLRLAVLASVSELMIRLVVLLLGLLLLITALCCSSKASRSQKSG
ncbi:scavenger receptor cysteine-rich type 1 protein M130-like [Centropristis striata]|uniref:scavenger receptor cysteine-rich type 1 protein M130-like n=1 Tax=Centropristis striata TaxID=184440 RepID=UPI0027DEB7AA|nr:scavenger receptor cysteine-rich type 1 protein M130-like [Centropristis striata]